MRLRTPWSQPRWLVLLCTLNGCLPAPTVVAELPSSPVPVPLSVPVQTDGSWVELEIAGQRFPAVDGVVELAGVPHGTHQVVVRAGAWFTRTAEHTEALEIDIEPPQILWSPRGERVEQGHTLPIVVQTDEPAVLKLTVLDRERPLHPSGENTWRALIGVPIRQEAGPLPATLVATDALGNRATHTLPITVTPVDWPFTGKLPISKKKASIPSPAIEKMRGERDPVYAEHTSDALWAGAMVQPTIGRHTSDFGSYREYPDGHRSHHDAQDIANKRGTRVNAANAGVVRLARSQAVHGNAILIGHGQGVVSLYSHLRTLRVKEGDTVSTGQHIGDMGSTGRSTGPHLHWGIVVDGVPVDPMQWTETGFDDATELVPLP